MNDAMPEPGELRFAEDLSGATLPSGVHARLVVVVRTLGPATVLALLVTEDIHIAGPADLVLTEREIGLDVQLCVQTDLAVSLVSSQLGPVVATVEPSVHGVVVRAFAEGTIPTGPVPDGVARGLPLGTPADPRWSMKLAELKDAQRLGRAVTGEADGDDLIATHGNDMSLDLTIELWEIELGVLGEMAVVRDQHQPTGRRPEFVLPEDASVRLVGRARRPDEGAATVTLDLGPGDSVHAELVLPGGLSGDVRSVTVIVRGSGGRDVRLELDLTDREDAVFGGGAPWPGGAGAPASIGVEVTLA